MATQNNNSFFDSEEEASRVLQAEGRKLTKIAIKVWRQYLGSYTPKKYIRTNKSMFSIKLKKVKKIDADTLGIEVTFENDLVYHDSIFGKGHKQGHAVMLISSGWRVKKGRHKDIENFGYKEGFDYLGKVKQAYEAVRDKRISFEIQWSGKSLR